MTREALQSIHRCLHPTGVLVINSFGELPPRPDFFRESLARTLQAVFRTVRLHASGNGNLFFVATDQVNPHPLWKTDPQIVLPACRLQVRETFDSLHEVTSPSGILLTDDYNPVEFFDAHAREQLRRQLAMGMKP